MCVLAVEIDRTEAVLSRRFGSVSSLPQGSGNEQIEAPIIDVLKPRQLLFINMTHY